MAPLGEWSHVATNVVGARGMPGTVGGCNCTDPCGIPGPSAADPPSPAADGNPVQALSAQ